MFVPKNWGFEDIQINEQYCSKRLVIYERHRCSIHMHKTKDEVISIAGGLICMETGDSPDNLVGIWVKLYRCVWFIMVSNKQIAIG